MDNKFYLYRFLDKDDNILYIGRTNNIRRRILTEHFANNTHLKEECYLQTRCVEFAEFFNESEQVAYEAILINQERPRYNTQFKDDGQFNLVLPNIKWLPFEWEFDGQMEIMKAMKRGTVSVTEILKQIYGNFETQTTARRAYWGFEKIDELAILASGTTVLIAGCSGTYKTAYALNVSLVNAKNNKKVLYINLKESSETVTLRLLATESSVELSKLQTNELTAKDLEALATATGNLSSGTIEFYNRTMSGNSLDSIVKTIKETDYDLVIIDDINSIMEFDRSYDHDKNIVVMNTIKQTAIDNQCPIIMLYSLNSKEIRTRQDKRPMITDLPNNSLCSYSDIVQMLYVKENDDNTSDTENKEVEIITVKNNLGYTGTATLSAKKDGVLSEE